MVRSGLTRLPLDDLDLLVIENVGNLVCPAEFDVGQHARAMVYAITEGEEKPLKYPVMFRTADVVVVNKIDLLPHLDFDLDAFRANLAAVNPTATVIELSARTGDGLDAWLDWLTPVGRRVRACRLRRPPAVYELWSTTRNWPPPGSTVARIGLSGARRVSRSASQSAAASASARSRQRAITALPRLRVRWSTVATMGAGSITNRWSGQGTTGAVAPLLVLQPRWASRSND